MRIEFARGDSYERGFILKNKATQAPIQTIWEDVYFTVKKYSTDSEPKFQKKLSDGGITADGDGHFTLRIAPEDTNGLPFGTYDCDIEFKLREYKRTFYGQLVLTKEVTHVNNE